MEYAEFLTRLGLPTVIVPMLVMILGVAVYCPRAYCYASELQARQHVKDGCTWDTYIETTMLSNEQHLVQPYTDLREPLLKIWSPGKATSLPSCIPSSLLRPQQPPPQFAPPPSDNPEDAPPSYQDVMGKTERYSLSIKAVRYLAGAELSQSGSRWASTHLA